MDPPGLHVEVQTKNIVVTLPGTSYTIAYYKPEKSPQLRVLSYTANEERGRADDARRVSCSRVGARERQGARAGVDRVAMLAMQLHTEVRGGSIIVTLPGAGYSVTYCMSLKGRHLHARSLPTQNDRDADMTIE
jgi:hypothetical protein